MPGPRACNRARHTYIGSSPSSALLVSGSTIFPCPCPCPSRFHSGQNAETGALIHMSTRNTEDPLEALEIHSGYWGSTRVLEIHPDTGDPF